MSDRSLAAAACSTSASPSLASGIPGSANPTPSAGTSSPNGGPVPGSMRTCEQLELMPNESMSSPEASPARGLAPPESVRDSTTPRPFCGERWPEPFASYDPATSSWRTWRTSLQSSEEPSGEKFSGTWPRSGTTQSGIAYQLRPSAPRTSVTGSSALLPTPMARTNSGTQVSSPSRTGGPMLKEALRMLPTPCERDWKGRGYKGQLPTELSLLPTPTSHERTQTPRQVDHGRQLANELHELKLLPTMHGMGKEGQARRPGPTGNELGRSITRLLPTPAAREYGSNQSPSDGAALRPSLDRLMRLLPTPVEGDSRNTRNETTNSGAGSTGHPGTTLSDVAYRWSGEATSPPSGAGRPSTGLRLSPWFVEWMIGAPLGWSDPDCPLSATEYRSIWATSWGSTSSSENESEQQPDAFR